ncbi:MAG: esterase/lipase family protein [Archangium sp.]
MRSRALLCLLLLSGCFLRARNVEERSGYTTVYGTVRAHPETPAGTRWVVLFKKGRSGWARYSQIRFSDVRSFEFLCKAGVYRLVAFVDVDGNNRLDDTEPRVEAAEVIDVQAGNPVIDVRLELEHALTKLDLPIELPDPDQLRMRGVVQLHVGDAANIDDARFNAEAGELGYWQTAEFTKRYGVGISFLEPYDPKKTPVLFIHGARGHPSEFTHFIKALDRKHFQAWVLSYPSGASLSFNSSMAQEMLETLWNRHHFESMHVVAHSMGGLLARDIVTQLASSPTGRYVNTLVTFSTPWGGVVAAKYGVEAAPSVVSSWNDVAVDSEFLNTMLERPLLPKHYLFFSFEGGTGTDGVVAISSQLQDDVQKQASKVFGFASTHTGILTNPEAATMLNDVLLTNE